MTARAGFGAAAAPRAGEAGRLRELIHMSGDYLVAATGQELGGSGDRRKGSLKWNA